MEVFGIIGMSFGLPAFTFAIVAMNRASSVKKELDNLKIVLLGFAMIAPAVRAAAFDGCTLPPSTCEFYEFNHF